MQRRTDAPASTANESDGEDATRRATPTRQALGRRGLVAGAAALVAGIVAKRTAQPVAATTIDTRFIATGSTGIGFDSTLAFFEHGVAAVGSVGGVAGSGNGNTGYGVAGTGSGGDQGVYGIGGSSNGVGVQGDGGGAAAGVYGKGGTSAYGVAGLGGGPNGTGVRGDGTGNGDGIYGQSTGGSQSKGVHGKHTGNGYGVYGEAGSGGYGVTGVADTIGINGTSTVGTGVFGQSSGNSVSRAIYGHHTANGYGVYGDAGNGGYGVTGVATTALGVVGQSTTGVGVYGAAAQGTGIYGLTNAAGNYGVLGQTTAANSTAIAGITNGNGSSAFSGGTGNANAFAAYFQGHVQIEGPFDVIGAGNKHAAVPHPDGSHRTIYSLESPEAWVEDFGTGTLTGGKAEVKLDADFAALIHTDEYHVFLTSHGDYHIHTPQRGASSFTVQVTSGAGKAASGTTGVTGTFSWRVVARPKTSAKVGRLAKVQIADAKALLPDPAKLPKPPEIPKAPPPAVPPTAP